MSILNAIKVKLGLSGTATNNFELDASAANGTMKLARSSGQDILTVDASGNVGIGATPITQNKFISQADTSDATTNALRANNSSGSPIFIVGGNGQTLVLAPAGLGYGTGAGGAVTQVTSKLTAVTLNKPCGTITTTADALAANTAAVFILNNSIIAAADSIVVSLKSGDASGGSYVIGVNAVGAGQAYIYIRNITAASRSETLQINFAVIKGATA